MLDFLRIVQPDLDTKPGSLARDLMVDAPAQELAKLYIELRNIANLQAIATATGTDLDKLARNFGLIRGSGAKASGVATLTTNNLDADIVIPANSTITARNGFTFRTQVSTSFLASSASVYRANAIRLRTDLELAGITDEFALEVAVEAVNPGASGNISKYSLTTVNIAGVSNVTNLQTFTGGSSTEEDSVFRSRVLGVFSGSNTGTTLGYVNALLANPRIVDILAVEPGDPLMVRDGTVVRTNDNGEEIVVTPGTGGKVDLYIQGSQLESITESFIFKDKSGKNDPTDPSNDFTLGQRGLSTLLNFQQRRRLSLQSGTLPFQPVDEVISVSGSLSGPNFIQKFTDESGQIKGSYEFLKDSGAFAGSPFGFDKLHFISNKIDLEDEATTKGIFNGQDALDFTDIDEIVEVRQDIIVSNEHPTLSSTDRSSITVIHTPISSVERVVNLTTGERYIISDQNPDGDDGELNETGRVLISGNTLPASTDTLQVNYIWNQVFDENIDYDDLSTLSEFRTVQDSIDWGFSNRILAEEQTTLLSGADGYHVILTHPASTVLNVNVVLEENVANVAGKLTLSETIENIVSVKDEDGREVFFTSLRNGSFSGQQITLPTDTLLSNGEVATVRYNPDDLFSPDGYERATFNGNVVRLPTDVATVGQVVYVDYVANVNTLLSTTALGSLPATGLRNQFVVNSSTVGNQPTSHVFVGNVIERNLRFAPSHLLMNIEGIPGRGKLSLIGTSFRRVEDIITVLHDGLTIDLASSIKNVLGLSSIPTTGFISYLASVERVKVENDLVSEVEFEFDTLNYSIKTNTYSNGTGINDSSLSATEIKLSSTTANTDERPTTGEKLRVVFYYTDTNQVESIVVSGAGPRITAHKYLYVSSLSIASGFTGLTGNVSGTITIANFNQPLSGSTYFTSYNYLAPKEGERITVQYNLNRLIGDATFTIEDVRPVTADVLLKAASKVELDVSVSIVASPSFKGTSTNLEDSVKETLTIFLTARGLNTTLDASDIINACYSVAGVDRVILTKFNTSGESGIKKSISAGRDEYLVAGVVEVEIETR